MVFLKSIGIAAGIRANLVLELPPDRYPVAAQPFITALLHPEVAQVVQLFGPQVSKCTNVNELRLGFSTTARNHMGAWGGGRGGGGGGAAWVTIPECFECVVGNTTMSPQGFLRHSWYA